MVNKKQQEEKMYSKIKQIVNHSKPEINSGEVMVEEAGYISRERRIKSLILAGQRLELMRKAGIYDYPEGVELPDLSKVRIDITRAKSFDLAEASMILTDVKRRIAAVEKGLTDQVKADKPVEPSQTVQDESGEFRNDVPVPTEEKKKK